MDSNREQNEFNMAVSYLARLNGIITGADNAALELDAHSWYHHLNALFRELTTEMNDAEIAAWKEKAKKINPAVVQQMQQNKRFQSQMISPELYDALSEYELFLRKILKSSGLQAKMKMNPGAMLG